jgi:hypothetical protein
MKQMMLCKLVIVKRRRSEMECLKMHIEFRGIREKFQTFYCNNA